jgi:hypothetical protein
MTEPNLNKSVRIHIRQEHIDEGKCRDPNKCMIKLAIAEALGIAHGYIKVDSRGIRVTRRKDFREIAYMPDKAVRALLAFDRKEPVKPFSVMLQFHKWTRVAKPASNDRREQINDARRKREAEGRTDRKYTGPSRRLMGISLTAETVRRVGLSTKQAEQLGI